MTVLDGKVYNELKKVKSFSIELENSIIELDLSTSFRIGGDQLDNIQWRKYKFKNIYKGYSSINLMYFYINKESKDDAYKRILLKDVTKDGLPHLDGKTGNIHPGRNYVKENSGNYDKIKQLVLCANGNNSDLGPLLSSDIKNKEDSYSLIFNIHQSCYFPLIQDDENLKNNWRYKLLKEFAFELYNNLDDKTILSDEILKEIGKK